MGCLDFCTVSADAFVPAFQRWDDHPACTVHGWEPLQDLGAGSFSQVVAARQASTGAVAALKVVFLDNPELDGETEAMLAAEGDLLLHLSHPNLVACSQVIKSPKAHVLVLELLRGCNVLDGLYRLSETYTERDAWGVFHQLMAALAYLHSRGIIHRDVKPENLVYADKLKGPPPRRTQTTPQRDGSPPQEHSPPVVKLVDLGMAWRCTGGATDRGVLGSAGFVAPEIIQGGEHTPAMDVFSAGVLLFIMLVGRKPFNIDDSEKLRYAKMGLAAAPGLKDPRWLDLSPDAKHLLMGMLAFDPARRLTAQQVLEHEWMATRGGRVLRMLGLDVALGAATVAEMRRLKFLCNGVVALRRVAAASAEASEVTRSRRRRGSFAKVSKSFAGSRKNSAPVSSESCREAEVYLDELKRMQRREASVRSGGRSLRGVARTIAAASYRQIHDAGGSVHRSAVAMAAAAEREEGAAPAAGPRSGGMRRSGTALLLSEVLAPGPDSSAHGGAGSASGSMRRPGSSNSLALLGASLRQYVDVSVHGGASVRNAALAALDSASSSSAAAPSTPRAMSTKPPSPSAPVLAADATGDVQTMSSTPVLPIDSGDSILKIIKVRTSIDPVLAASSGIRRSLDKKIHNGKLSPSAATSPLHGSQSSSAGNSASGGRRRVHSIKALDG